MTISAVVFDLDDTLADTADLRLSSHGVRRTPFDVLRVCPAGQPLTEVTITDEHRRLPGQLIARGYRTAIITRSPAPYASTLVGLLRIDTERLLASNAGSTPAAKLELLADEWALPPDEFLYVGDTEQDREAARATGAQFCFAARGMPAAVLEQLPERVAPWSETGCVPIVPGGPFNMRCGNCGLALALIRDERPAGCPGCEAAFLDADRTPQSIPGAWVPGDDAMNDVIDTILWAAPLSEAEVAAIEGSEHRDLAAAAAFSALVDHPEQHRTRLQALALHHLPPEARDCVLVLDLEEGRFGFDPRLVTLNEIADGLGPTAVSTAAKLFPPVRESPIPIPEARCEVPLESFWPFHKDPYGGAIWSKLKNWRGGNHGASGPLVHQSLLHFIALTLAGHLPDGAAQSGVAIVPAPSSPMSAQQPGQLSLRLAYRIGELSGCQVLSALTKVDGTIACENDLTGRAVVLVDDQTTTTGPGNTVTRCAAALLGAGANVVRVLTWSSSHQVTDPVTSDCWLGQHHMACRQHDQSQATLNGSEPF